MVDGQGSGRALALSFVIPRVVITMQVSPALDE